MARVHNFSNSPCSYIPLIIRQCMCRFSRKRLARSYWVYKLGVCIECAIPMWYLFTYICTYLLRTRFWEEDNYHDIVGGGGEGKATYLTRRGEKKRDGLPCEITVFYINQVPECVGSVGGARSSRECTRAETTIHHCNWWFVSWICQWHELAVTQYRGTWHKTSMNWYSRATRLQ